MGLRTELHIDGDRCKDCGSLLAERGSVWTTKRRIRDGMIITEVEMLCLRCATITAVEYLGELLPSERMQELTRNWNASPRFAFSHRGRG